MESKLEMKSFCRKKKYSNIFKLTRDNNIYKMNGIFFYQRKLFLNNLFAGKLFLMHLLRTLTINPSQKKTGLVDSTGVTDREWVPLPSHRINHIIDNRTTALNIIY